MKKDEHKSKNTFTEIFDHVIWYIIFIIFMLCVAYSNAHSEKYIKFTGTLKCSDIVTK